MIIYLGLLVPQEMEGTVSGLEVVTLNHIVETPKTNNK
jgi:hypothetical protein